MSYNWDGLMELLSGKYRPTWASLCAGSDVKGIMELSDGKYRPKADAHGVCDEKTGIMVNDGTGKYFPRITLGHQYSCCAGESCANCDGSLWDSGKTPKVVQAVVSGITLGECADADPNGTFILTQHSDPNYPCFFFTTNDIFGYYWEPYFGASCLHYPLMSSCFHIISGEETIPWKHYYFYGCDDECLSTLTYSNFAQSVDDVCGSTEQDKTVGGCTFVAYYLHRAAYGGTVTVSWPI